MSGQTASQIAFKDLPKVGEPLAEGTFAGILTQPDGTHVAIVLLPAWSEDLTWKKAVNWAEKQGGALPSRPAAALLYANLKGSLKPRWHWSNQTHDDDTSYAWSCFFDNGGQYNDLKSYEGCAVAVRSIPLSA